MVCESLQSRTWPMLICVALACTTASPAWIGSTSSSTAAKRKTIFLAVCTASMIFLSGRIFLEKPGGRGGNYPLHEKQNRGSHCNLY